MFLYSNLAGTNLQKAFYHSHNNGEDKLTNRERLDIQYLYVRNFPSDCHSPKPTLLG